MNGKRVLGWVLLWACLLGSAIRSDTSSLLAVTSVPASEAQEPGLEFTVTTSVGGWVRQCIGCRPFVGDSTPHKVHVDQAGHVHIIHGGPYLYHTWYDGSGWQTETVDPTVSNHFDVSSVLDEDGQLHVSYILTEQDAVKYAYQGPHGWQIRTVDVQPDDTQYMIYTSLALDGQGRPHIAYWNAYQGELWYAYQDAVGWHRQVAASSGDACRGISLDLDSGDKPHIGYMFSGWDEALRYVRLGADGWQEETVSAQGNLWVGSPGWLALDSIDRPHVSYRDGNQDALLYAYRDASGWYTETVDTGNVGHTGAALVLDDSDRPHLSYWEDFEGLRYAYRNAEGWQVGLVEAMDQYGAPSLALDASGVPHVSYLVEVHYPDDLRQLKHATLDGAIWQSEVVLIGGTSAQSSLAVDSNDVPHVTYVTFPWSLVYAYRDAGNWHSEIVDSCEPFRYTCYHALALDGDDAPHIAYQDHYQLKYATLEAGGWHTETLESNNSGYAVSIALDDDGYPHLSYWTSYHMFDLLYAYLDASGWHSETIATGLGEPNSATSLALDAGGYPHLTFSWYGEPAGLRYAYKDAGGWHVESLNGEDGRDASLVLDSTGRPHIGYRGYVAAEDSVRIRYAVKEASGWQFQSVDDPVDYGEGNVQLALDASETPHLAYFDGINVRLRYAVRDADSWTIQTVDDVGSVGWNPSLALDGSGSPHIAYDDLWLNSCKYAYLTDALPYAFSLATTGGPPPGYVGSTVHHRFWLTNEGTQLDVYNLDLVGQGWPTVFSDVLGLLDPGEGADVVVAVSIPSDVPLDAVDEVELVITSMGDRCVYIQVPLRTQVKPRTLYLPVLFSQ